MQKARRSSERLDCCKHDGLLVPPDQIYNFSRIADAISLWHQDLHFQKSGGAEPVKIEFLSDRRKKEIEQRYEPRRRRARADSAIQPVDDRHGMGVEDARAEAPTTRVEPADNSLLTRSASASREHF